MSKTTTRLVPVLFAAGMVTGCKFNAEIVRLSDGRQCIVKLPLSNWVQETIECESGVTVETIEEGSAP